MKILITGGTGLTGRTLVKRLAREHELFLLVRNLTADFESSTIHPVVSDLEDVQDLSNLEAQLPQKLDAVIHLAQSYRFREFPAGAMSVTNVNVVATAHLLESAARKGVQHFICASTGGVYAEQPGQRAIVESDPIRSDAALGYYAATKRAAELLAMQYQKSFKVAIVRPFFLYGPQQRVDMLFARLIQQVATKQVIEIVGEQGLVFSPTFHEDGALALQAILEQGFEGVMNLAGSEELTLRNVIERIGLALGEDPIISMKSGISTRLVGDNTCMRTLLGSTSLTPFAEGLTRMLRK